MAQTAAEWLAEKYNYITWMRNRDEISAGTADQWRREYLEQAKQMEKEQHGDTWLESAASYYGDDYIGKQQTFDQYYTQTYYTRLQNETN